MNGLRETKKAATKELIAECAVRIALVDGIDKLTVARVTAAADVSPRTFHNYFPSRDSALRWYLESHLTVLKKKLIEHIKQEESIINAVEAIVIEGLEEDLNSPSSLLSLYHLGQILETIDYGTTTKVWSTVLADGLNQLTPLTDLSEFECYTILSIAAEAGLKATGYQYPNLSKRAIIKNVRWTFSLLRNGIYPTYGLTDD